MGKKRKRKAKPEMDQASEEEQTSAEDEESSEEVDDNEDTEETTEEEQRKSRRQKIAEIDRALAKNLEAREAGKRRDLRDPLTKFFQDTGKTAIKYKNTISIVLMILIVALFLIAYNVITKPDVEVTDWTTLAAENDIDNLRTLARKWEGKKIEPEVYRKLFFAFKNDSKRSQIDRLEGQLDVAKKILDNFEKDSKQKDLCDLMHTEMTRIEKDLEFLKNRVEVIEKGIEVPEQKTVVLPSDSEDTIEVSIVTNYGSINLELFDKVCPNSVAAFMYLVQSGFYQEDGLGGFIKRAKATNGVGRLVIGEMPAMDYQNQSKKYNDLKDIDTRVSKLADKWHPKFNERADGLSWTLPLEPAGLKQKCVKGALVAWLDDASNPESASYKFSILLGDDDKLTGQYMVIGSVKRIFEEGADVQNKQQILPEAKLEAEAFTVASQIGSDGDKIKYTLVQKTKAQRIYTKLFVKNGDQYVAVPSVRYYTKRGEEEFIVGSADDAEYVLANPGMYKFIAEGTFYTDSEGKIVKAETDIYQPVFPEDTMDSVQFEFAKFMPVPSFRSSFINHVNALITKELPAFEDAVNDKAELLGKEYMPMVLYKDLPMEILIREKKPPKTEKFVFTTDKDSQLYFENDLNSANNPNQRNPMQGMPNPGGFNAGGSNPGGISLGGANGGATSIPLGR